MEVLQLKLALAQAQVSAAEKEVENIRLQILLFEQKEKEKNQSLNPDNSGIHEGEEFEVYDTNICDGDDRLVFPSTTPFSEVKKRCIEIGSHAFVTKSGCQIYVRSPPSEKNNRDYPTMKKNAEKRVKEQKHNTKGYKTYLFDY